MNHFLRLTLIALCSSAALLGTALMVASALLAWRMLRAPLVPATRAG